MKKPLPPTKLLPRHCNQTTRLPDNDASEDENKPMDSDDESQITATSGNPPDFFTPEQTDSESATAQLVNSNQPSTAESLPATQLLKLLMLQLRPGN